MVDREMSRGEIEKEFHVSANGQTPFPPELSTTYIPFVTPICVTLARRIRKSVEFFRVPDTSDYHSIR